MFFERAGPVWDTLCQLEQRFDEAGIDYVLIGGLALNAHNYARQTIDVDVDPAEVSRARTKPTTQLYLLQAGSFRQRQDADRRRAELLLLGLEPKIEGSNGDNGRWFRVYVGPFESRSQLAKARSLTAAQDIDTLLLKRSKP